MKNGGIIGPKNNTSVSSGGGFFSIKESFSIIKSGKWPDGKFDGSSPERAAINAAAILQYSPNAPSGNYWIKRTSGAPIQVYCDMVRDGGGWMLLNGSNSTISVNKGSASWSGDFLNVGIQETDCGNNPLGYRLLNIPFESWTESRMLMRRITTIGQCSGISFSGGTQNFSGYYNTTANDDNAIEQYSGISNATSNSTCTWGDGIWANGTNQPQNMSGLKLFWAFRATGTNITPSHSVQCAGGSGSHVHKWYIR